MTINNKPSYNPAVEDSFLTFIQQIIRDYLKQNLFTCNIFKIVAVNENTVNIAPVVKTQQTNGQILEITSNDYINNVPVLFVGNSSNKTTFKLNIGDYGIGLSFKNNCNSYINNGTEPIANNNLFNIMNTVFVPLNTQNITDNTIIDNQGTQIELTNETVNINKPTNITGNVSISGNNTVSGNIDGATYSVGGTAGVSGVFVDTPSGKSITITNGIITAIS